MEKTPTIHKVFDITGKAFLVAGGSPDPGKDMTAALEKEGAADVITSCNGPTGASRKNCTCSLFVLHSFIGP